MMIEGQVENWISIIDIGFKSLFSVIGPAKTSMLFLMNTFRNRAFALYALNAPFSAWTCWNIVKPFLEQQTVDKLNMFNKSNPEPLFEYLNPKQIEERFGGTAPNL